MYLQILVVKKVNAGGYINSTLPTTPVMMLYDVMPKNTYPCRVQQFQLYQSISDSEQLTPLAMSEGYFVDRKHLYLDKLFWGLVTSCHILHKHRIFDAYGHVSVRNPDNPSTFFLPSNQAPALLDSVEGIVEYDIEGGNPVGETTKSHYVERFIHSEIYKRYPGINAVVHSHCHDILPFCITDVPLKASIHMAGFLGVDGAPVWDIQTAYSSDDSRRDLLVRSTAHGKSLAAALRPETSAGFVYSKVRAALPAALTSSGVLPGRKADEGKPENLVVLMRGHGFTTCAESLEMAVFQAIYTKEAASVHTLGLSLLTSKDLEGTVEGKIGEDGKISGGKIRSKDLANIKFLSDREANDAHQMALDSMMRPWALWVREVEVDPLYQNKVKKEGEERS